MVDGCETRHSQTPERELKHAGDGRRAYGVSSLSLGSLRRYYLGEWMNDVMMDGWMNG